MKTIDPLYTYNVQELMDLAADLVVEFNDDSEEYVIRELNNGGEEIVHKIPVLYHIMSGLQGEIARKEIKISQLNEKIKEMGIELSKLKRADNNPEKLPEHIEKFCEENNLDKVIIRILYRTVNSPEFTKKLVEDYIGVKDKNAD